MSKIMVNGQITCKYRFEEYLESLATNDWELSIAQSRWRDLRIRLNRKDDQSYGRTWILGVNGHKYTIDPVMSEEEWKIHNLICVLDLIDDFGEAYISLNEELDELMRAYYNN